MTRYETFMHIRVWAKKRGIYDNGDAKTQLIKLMEEVGELSEGILKNDHEEIKDAIGDCVVVLTNLAYLCSLTLEDYRESYTIEDCIESAYNEIKDRTGSMENGTFVKS